ncbi:MAG TPA: PKD domain-containing protein, partial [Acidimicrobiales bacterium]|nr:PKD domain-containing protein [Acidimicrobiales bacterium]
VGNNPEGIAITPDGGTAYVSNDGSSTVTPIDLATNTAGTAIPVGGAPVGLAVTPDGRTAYVAIPSNNTVVPINTSTNTAGVAIPVGNGPSAIAITPDQAPTAEFSVSGTSVGSPTIFDAASSGSPVGTIASYAWNFGDGTSMTTTSPVTSHSYASVGTYSVSLNVTNSAGTSTTEVFTGQTASNNGGPSAMTTQNVAVTAQPTTKPPTTVPQTQLAKVLIMSGRVLLRKESLPVKLSCRRSACRGSLELTERAVVKLRKGEGLVSRVENLVLGRTAYRIGRGKSAFVDLRLNPVGRRVLADVANQPRRAIFIAKVESGRTTRRSTVIV